MTEVRGLCLASTTVLHTLAGVQLWLHRPTHQGLLTIDGSSFLRYNRARTIGPNGGNMILTTKHKGNIALARALSYFGEKGYYLFLPVGDNGGAIDLAVSEDGMSLKRVQCKYTQLRHHSMLKRYPNDPVWQVNLYQTGRRERDGHVIGELIYEENSFDWLFIATPGGDYLIDWKSYCQELGKVPGTIRLGKYAEKYRITSV